MNCDLMRIWVNARSGFHFARELFPNRQKGYVRVTKDIGNLASNLHTATVTEGKTRKMYLDIANLIMDGMPKWGKRVAVKLLKTYDLDPVIKEWLKKHEKIR